MSRAAIVKIVQLKSDYLACVVSTESKEMILTHTLCFQQTLVKTNHTVLLTVH